MRIIAILLSQLVLLSAIAAPVCAHACHFTSESFVNVERGCCHIAALNSHGNHHDSKPASTCHKTEDTSNKGDQSQCCIPNRDLVVILDQSIEHASTSLALEPTIFIQPFLSATKLHPDSYVADFSCLNRPPPEIRRRDQFRALYQVFRC